jgi:ATP-dependent DNA helicase RecG
MLGVILDTVQKVGNRVGNKVGNNLTDNQLMILENIKLDSKISATKSSEKIGIYKRKIEENLAKLKELNILRRVNGTRGYWEIIDEI